MGTDYFGNKYFEIPAQPQIGKRRAERWFEPSEKRDENFDRELTAEWESWLRHRRLDLNRGNCYALNVMRFLFCILTALTRQPTKN